MNPTTLIALLRSRAGVLLAALLIIVTVFGLAGLFRPRAASTVTKSFTQTVSNDSSSVVREPVSATRSLPPAPPAAATNKPFTGLIIHVELPPDTNPPSLGVYAPYGRLIACQLVNTVDSANINTPIIVLVTAPLFHAGRVVIPAGTEIHGRAKVDRMRDRIVADGPWTIVWQTGETLTVQGTALDRDASPDGVRWGPTDGSAGLRGQVLRSDSLAAAKAFIGAFLSGVASGLQETRSTVYGVDVPGTARNATLAGTSQVFNRYANEIMDAVRRDGVYVRVPAGTQMYLYVSQTIDRSQSKVGGMPAGAALPPSTTETKPNPSNP